MSDGDVVDVTVFGSLRNDASGERACYRGNGYLPSSATEVTIPGEHGKRFVVLAKAAPGKPFFRCGTDEVQLRTLLHIYGTDEEYEARYCRRHEDEDGDSLPPPAKRPCVKDEEDEKKPCQ